MSDERQRKDNELSRVYSEGAWPEPRRQIDEAILAASRRAARARHPILHRWGAPFALAATVVLAFTLALVVSERESGRELKEFFNFDYSKPVEKRASEAKREAAPRAEGKVDTAPKAEAAPKAEVAPRTGGAPVSGAAKAPVAPAAQPLRRPDAPADPERAERIRRDLEQLDETRRARDAAPREPTQPSEPSAEMLQAAPAPGAGPSAAVASVRSLASASAGTRRPETWLEDIRKLRAAGKTPEAERELVEFRKRYPDYRLPDDLR